MISIADFENASRADRASLVFEHGEELASRIFMYFTIRLYSLSDFCVEIWYRQDYNKIDKIDVVKMEDVFHLYEKEIDISGIFDGEEE